VPYLGIEVADPLEMTEEAVQRLGNLCADLDA